MVVLKPFKVQENQDTVSNKFLHLHVWRIHIPQKLILGQDRSGHNAIENETVNPEGCSAIKRTYMNVLVILGHPRRDSYCAALAEAYIRGAEESYIHVEYVKLADLEFEMNVLTPSPQQQYLEQDLRRMQKLILWADHLVFVFPTWWGSVPAILKAFLDRTLTPGFAFREVQVDAFDRLLAPRSAQIITTMDTPKLIDRLINGAPIQRSIGRS